MFDSRESWYLRPQDEEDDDEQFYDIYSESKLGTCLIYECSCHFGSVKRKFANLSFTKPQNLSNPVILAPKSYKCALSVLFLVF